MDYDSIKALSWSTLKNIHRSPLLYCYRLDHPEPPKSDYVIGRAIHCAILEPEKFGSRYAECTVRRDKRTKVYKAWLEEHPDVEALTSVEMQIVMASAESVSRHPVAKKMLSGCRTEVSLEWTDPDTGFSCKGRVDAIRDAVKEIKSDRDPEPRRFATHAAQLLYHGQIAFYHYGARTLGLIDGTKMPEIIAVEKEPPYDVAAYVMKPEDLAAGRTLCLRLMQKLATCIETDMWPGIAPDLQYLELPPWAAGLDTEPMGW